VKMFGADKTRMIELPYGETSYDSVVNRFHLIPKRHDRRTDRRTDREIAISISRVSMLTRDKNDIIEAVHQTSACAKALYPYHSSVKVLSPAVDLIPRPTLLVCDMWRRIFIVSNSTKMLLLFTSLQNIVILSIIVILHTGVIGTLRRRLTYIFFSFNKKFNIITFSPTKFGLSIFTVRGHKFEVSF